MLFRPKIKYIRVLSPYKIVCDLLPIYTLLLILFLHWFDYVHFIELNSAPHMVKGFRMWLKKVLFLLKILPALSTEPIFSALHQSPHARMRSVESCQCGKSENINSVRTLNHPPLSFYRDGFVLFSVFLDVPFYTTFIKWVLLALLRPVSVVLSLAVLMFACMVACHRVTPCTTWMNLQVFVIATAWMGGGGDLSLCNWCTTDLTEKLALVITQSSQRNSKMSAYLFLQTLSNGFLSLP